MTSQQRAYLAGFLDADGSMMIQLRPRKEMRFLFRPKTIVVFYQNSKNHEILKDLQQIIQAGYVYKRNDCMSELRVEGHQRVYELLRKLYKYLRFKHKRADLMLKALKILMKRRYSLDEFLTVCDLADQISNLNYTSRARKYTSKYVRQVLKNHSIIPVTTGVSA
ncbi:MAG: LAGLIDADG family homing endonuclease [Patescibacteria group bacterium]